MSDHIYFVKPVEIPFPHCEKYRAYVVYAASQDVMNIKPVKGFKTLKEAQVYRDKLMSEQGKESCTK